MIPDRARASMLGFAALAGFASYHWFALLADPPLGRWLLLVGAALAAAATLSILAGRRRARALAAIVATLAVAVGLLAVGVPVRLLAPGSWGELSDLIAGGLAGASELDLPYSGGEPWTRIGILLAAPLALALAAALAFWPTRSAPRTRTGIALVVLVALYGVSVTWESPSAELARGLGLLACVAAFLWLGSVARPRLATGLAALGLAALAALPAAAQVETRGPAVDYTGWRIFGEKRTASFDWDHRYGPLEWPQQGTEMFEVRGVSRPLYWKTQVLDSFDGTAWTRDGPAGVAIDGGPSGVIGAGPDTLLRNRQWVESFDVSIRGLRSPLLVTSGVTREVAGIDAATPGSDGTTPASRELAGGDEYTVSAYAPDPSADRLRRADERRYPRWLERYTSLLLPQTRGPGLGGPGAPADPLSLVTVPVRGSQRGAARLIGNTPYVRVRRLARRLTEDADGRYEAVLAIKRHLIEGYEYRQDVPKHRRPLPAFLFGDRAGYCQQFSGGMAVMLRLIGIPSRVVTGFAPGLPDPDVEGAYLVRDTDAHSWVEVWFPGVGWVVVDPTPSAAPARTETLAGGVGARGPDRGLGRAFAIEEAAESGPLPGLDLSRATDGRSPVSVIVAFVIVALLGALGEAYRRRRARLLAPSGAAAQARELAAAVARVPDDAHPALTLLELERRLAAALGAEAAAYPAALRANRYRRGRPRRPGPAQRRRLRRALGRGGGARGRWRALRAIPPGGPSA